MVNLRSPRDRQMSRYWSCYLEEYSTICTLLLAGASVWKSLNLASSCSPFSSFSSLPPPLPGIRCSRTYLLDSIYTMVVSNDFYWFTKLCTVLRPSRWLPRDSFLMKGGCFLMKEYNNGWTAWKVKTIKEVVGFYFPSSCLHRTHCLSVKSLLLVYDNLFWCFSGKCFRARLKSSSPLREEAAFPFLVDTSCYSLHVPSNLTFRCFHL